jgi:hypothetical protein
MKKPSETIELIRRLAEEKKRRQQASSKTGNTLANGQNRWVRFQHYVWDKRKG